MWLLLAFIAVPLIEIALFIQIGGAIGLWSTLAVVVITAIIGTTLVKGQGLRAIQELQSSVSRLSDPSEPLAHGAMILFSGALLLTPGFFTDAVGFALLVPGVRKAIFGWLRTRIRFQEVNVNLHAGHDPFHQPNQGSTDDIIDGEFSEVEAPKKPAAKPSGWTKH